VINLKALSANKLGPSGAKALAAALSTNHTLTHLDISNNFIGAEGSRYIAEIFPTNTTLKLVHLNRSYPPFFFWKPTTRLTALFPLRQPNRLLRSTLFITRHGKQQDFGIS